MLLLLLLNMLLLYMFIMLNYYSLIILLVSSLAVPRRAEGLHEPETASLRSYIQASRPNAAVAR